MNIEEVLDDVARHLDFVYATNQFSIRDNEMKEMLIEINILRMENKKLKSIIKEVREYAEEIIEFVGDVSWVEIPSEDYIKKWQDILEILDKVGD